MNVLVLLITGLTIVGILVFHQYRKTKLEGLAGNSGNRDHLVGLSQEAAVLGSSIDVFSELSEEYFISVSSNGFVDLCKINDALKATIDLCTKLDTSKDMERRDEILRYVYVKRGKGAAPGVLFQMMKEDLIQSLEDWDDRMAEILMKIANGIRTSSSSFKSVGRYRTTKRHNTTQMLNHVVGLVRR